MSQQPGEAEAYPGTDEPTLQLDRARLEAARIRAAALAEAEQLRVSARSEADKLVLEAQRRADVIDERGRQELTWRRRQIRLEQEQLARRQHALAAQLASLSELAARAEDLPATDAEAEPAVSAESEQTAGRIVETA